MKPRFAWLYIGVWTVFAALYGVMVISAPGTSILAAISAAFFTVLPAALMGLVVWRAAKRLSWDGSRRIRFFGIHAVGALIYAIIWGALTTVQIAVFAPKPVLDIYVQRALGWQILMGVMMYAVIAGISYVVEATERLAEQRALAASAELSALRSQLNPHFLFNTLHSITSLVGQNPQVAEGALVRFGSLLRYVLDSSRRASDDATLEQELDFVRGYLEIEKMRLGERLNVVESIDPEALECTIPVLTLQPIVENAVEHGIVPRADGGTVSIKAAMNDGRLSLVIADDGVGANANEISSADGIGLSLVERRLRVRFADRASMNVETALGKGMTVSIAVPAI